MKLGHNQKSTNVCCVPGCSRDRKNLFRFPNPATRPQIFEQWVKAIKSSKFGSLNDYEVIKNLFVCSYHFLSEDFWPESRRIRFSAVPALNLPGEEPKVDQDYCSTIVSSSSGIEISEDESNHELIDGDILQNDLPIPFDTAKPYRVPTFLSTITESLLGNSTTDTAVRHETEQRQFNSVKRHSQSELEVCRVCFSMLSEKEAINLDETSREVSYIKIMLESVLPGLNLDLYSQPVICPECTELLVYSHQLKQKWLTTESKLGRIANSKRHDEKRPDSIIRKKLLKENKNPPKDVKSRPQTDENHSTQHPSSDFKCSFCGRDFATLQLLNRHVSVHRSRPIYRCSTCDTQFEHLRSLKNHVRSHFLGELQRCQYCSKSFKNADDLHRHLSKDHSESLNGGGRVEFRERRLKDYALSEDEEERIGDI